MKITVTRDDGTTEDITTLVQIAYDVATHSMDWGSGFLDREETDGLVLLAEACRFPDCEEKIAEVWRARYEAMPVPGSRTVRASHTELKAIAKERGETFWFQVKPTPEEAAELLREARQTMAGEGQ